MQKRSVLTGLCIFLAIFFLTIPLFSYAQKDPAKQAKTESTPATPTAEVRFDGKVLFEIKERIFSFSPEDRARAITERIDALSKDSLLRLDEIQAIDSDEGAAISYRDRTIMTITDRDARVAGKPRLTLAQENAQKIRISIKEKQARYSFRSILLWHSLRAHHYRGAHSDSYPVQMDFSNNLRNCTLMEGHQDTFHCNTGFRGFKC